VLCNIFSKGTSAGDDKSNKDGPLLHVVLEDSVAGDLGDCPKTIMDVYLSKTWFNSSLAASTSPNIKYIQKQ